MLKSSAVTTLNQRRNARLYLTGLTASMLGDSAMTLVAAIWVKSLTGSNAATALVSAVIYAPALLAPLTGAVADRVRRRPLLLATNMAMAAILPWLLLVDRGERVWLIYAAMLGYGLAMAVTDPAENALFPVLFDEAFRARLNGLRLTIQEGCKLMAPLIGAGMFAALGGGWVAALDAATFCVAAFAITRLRVEEAPPAAREQSWVSELAAGATHLRRVREVRQLVIAAALAMIFSGIAFAAQFALLDALHRDPSFFGVLTTLLGAGSIIAGLSSSRVIKRYGERVLALLGLLDVALSYGLLAVGWLPAALAGAFLRGFALPWIVIATITIAQRLTPLDLQGRVSAAVTVLLFAPQPLAQASGAAIIDHATYRQVDLAVAATGLVLATSLRRAGAGVKSRPRRKAPFRLARAAAARVAAAARASPPMRHRERPRRAVRRRHRAAPARSRSGGSRTAVRAASPGRHRRTRDPVRSSAGCAPRWPAPAAGGSSGRRRARGRATAPGRARSCRPAPARAAPSARC